MQEIIVAVIVVFACWFTLKRYLPLSIRMAIAERVADLCIRFGWITLARRLRTRHTRVAQAPACGGCNHCDQAGDGRAQQQVQGSITPDALRNTIRR